jgi:hypothetical protein
MEYSLFKQRTAAINIGVKPFGEGVSQQGIQTIHVNWKPPVDAKLSRHMHALGDMLLHQKIEEANEEAIRRLNAAEGHWIGLEKAIKAIPGFKENLILHSGPPIAWKDMIDVQKRGIKYGAIHAGLAKTMEEAEGMVLAGEIEIGSCNDRYAIGAATGIVTHNMVVNVVEDVVHHNKAYCIPFEGRNGLGAWAMWNPEIERNLLEIEDYFAPAVDLVLKKNGGINVRNILAKGMLMGDESHTRQAACGALLVSEIVPMLLSDEELDAATIKRVTEMFVGNERWFHPLGMSCSLASMRAIKGLPYCTIVTSIAQNGVETGIKVADMGEQWFKTAAPRFVGSYFSTQWGPEDAVPYMGDSTATETYGMGAFSAAAAPTVLRLRGGGWREAKAQSEELRSICAGTNNNFPIPLLDFAGPGMGIDIRKVCQTGITPICHGGIVNKTGGQIGAGAARFGIEHYISAMHAFLDKYGVQ